MLDRVDEIRLEAMDDQHLFPLSAAYEGLLLDMGLRNNDGGQFFTPREAVRAMVRVVAPEVGETVFDPCCGTGGFLAQVARVHGPATRRCRHRASAREAGPRDVLGLGRRTTSSIPIALANLVLHGIDQPRNRSTAIPSPGHGSTMGCSGPLRPLST